MCQYYGKTGCIFGGGIKINCFFCFIPLYGVIMRDQVFDRNCEIIYKIFMNLIKTPFFL